MTFLLHFKRPNIFYNNIDLTGSDLKSQILTCQNSKNLIRNLTNRFFLSYANRIYREFWQIFYHGGSAFKYHIQTCFCICFFDFYFYQNVFFISIFFYYCIRGNGKKTSLLKKCFSYLWSAKLPREIDRDNCLFFSIICNM